jgi:hypothetical protein
LDKQSGIHEVDEVASAGGADIDGDGTLEHSNIHIGEGQWGTDPANDSDVPQTDVVVEADFAGGTADRLKTEQWTDGISDNYALYGIDVQYNIDDTVTAVDTNALAQVVSTAILASDEPSDLSLLVVNDPLGDLEENTPLEGSTGVNIQRIAEVYPNSTGNCLQGQLIWGVAREVPPQSSTGTHIVAAEAITDINTNVNPEDVTDSQYGSQLQLVSAFVAMNQVSISPTVLKNY